MRGRSDVLGEPLEALACRIQVLGVSTEASVRAGTTCLTHPRGLVCAGPTCLASPRRRCLPRSHVPGGVNDGPTRARPMRLSRPQRPRVHWIHIHSRILFAGPTCLAGPHRPCVLQSEVHGGFTLPFVCCVDIRRLAGSQIRLGGQIHIPDGFTRLFSWIQCVPWRPHHAALWLFGHLVCQIRNMIKAAMEITDQSLRI